MAGRRSTSPGMCRPGDPAGSALSSTGAARAAWRGVGVATAIRRDDKAEALGLTYEEYTLEILERGRLLQADDVELVAAIRAKCRRSRKKPPSF
jgi:hypothetical protein